MFKPAVKRPALYTGGKAGFDAAGNVFVCLASGGGLSVVDMQAPLGKIKASLAADEELTSFAISRRDVVATASVKGLIRLFELDTGVEIRHFASHHSGPVCEMAFDPSGECLATGSTDFAVRVWSASGGFASHNFRGHKAIIASLRFHPSTSKLWLCSSDLSGQVCVWDLMAKQAICWLRNHLSAVPSSAFVDLNTLVTAGRDKILSVWVVSAKGELLKSLPAGEALEAVEAVSGSGRFLTAGSEGVIRLWRLSDFSVLLSVPSVGPLTGLVTAGPKIVCAYSAQECLMGFYKTDSASLPEAKPRLVGYDDEMMDVAWLDDERVLVATTASQPRVYSLTTGTVNMLSPGHDGPVLSCCVSRKGGFIVTGGKDQTANVYSASSLERLGVCNGHNGAVVAMAACESSLHFVTTGGEDASLHLWRLVVGKGPKSLAHRVAHTKAVTAVCMSPNDKLVGSASLDKTAKVWALDVAKGALELEVELKGHRRAVTCMAFSAVDRACVTGSADCTLRVWGVSDGACLRTLEGHGSAVTVALFLPGGTRLCSFAADGVLKTWDVRASSCLQTAAEHTDRVWAAELNNSRLLSVGESGELVVWDDASEAEAAAQLEAVRAATARKDELERAVRQKDLLKACCLALQLDRPHQLRTLLQEAPDEDVLAMVADCDDEALRRLSTAVVAWNTQSRSSVVAQRVIAVMLRQPSIVRRLGGKVINELCEGALPYTQRHLARLEKLQKMSYIVDQITDV